MHRRDRHLLVTALESGAVVIDIRPRSKRKTPKAYIKPGRKHRPKWRLH